MPAQRDISVAELMLPKTGAMLLNAWNSEKIIAIF
jgi:hypothetical protein